MNSSMHDQFLKDLNQNIGIVHRVCTTFFFNDWGEREDVLQEIMYQLWKSYPHFNGASKFSTWMYKVSLNTAITHVRKSKRAPEKEKLTDKYNQIAESNEQLHTEEKMKLLYAGIHTLSAIDKSIILLYLEENSYDEIASITGLTKTNVSVRLVRIKKSLEEKLKSNF
ncbi:MAG: sigma-70 family RNA polymerase sigma factor [Chitinophagales bacterium]